MVTVTIKAPTTPPFRNLRASPHKAGLHGALSQTAGSFQVAGASRTGSLPRHLALAFPNRPPPMPHPAAPIPSPAPRIATQAPLFPHLATIFINLAVPTPNPGPLKFTLGAIKPSLGILKFMPAPSNFYPFLLPRTLTTH